MKKSAAEPLTTEHSSSYLCQEEDNSLVLMVNNVNVVAFQFICL